MGAKVARTLKVARTVEVRMDPHRCLLGVSTKPKKGGTFALLSTVRRVAHMPKQAARANEESTFVPVLHVEENTLQWDVEVQRILLDYKWNRMHVYRN